MPIYFCPIEPNAAFSIESIGYDWLQEPIVRQQGHPYYHWLQTTTGVGIVTMGKQEVTLKMGQGILISPFIPHSYESSNNEIWHTSFLTITGKLTPHLPEVLGKKDFYLAENYTDFSFSNWLRTTAQELEASTIPTVNELAAYHFLMQIRSCTQRNQAQAHLLFETYVQPLLDWINDQYDQPLTLSAAAQYIYVSPQYINRLFNRFLGLSFQQYLLKLRMRKAKEFLVQHPQLKILEIAAMVGYQDTSYFIANFKKETGMTPEQFRLLY